MAHSHSACTAQGEQRTAWIENKIRKKSWLGGPPVTEPGPTPLLNCVSPAARLQQLARVVVAREARRTAARPAVVHLGPADGQQSVVLFQI